MYVRIKAATTEGRRLALHAEGAFSLRSAERRAVLMVTYNELFALLGLIVSIITLVVLVTKKK